VIGVVIFFLFLALAYFAPAVFEGRELFQQDVAGASGNASDVYKHMEATGEGFSYWTNSLFGGMPMYQIAPSYPSVGIIRTIQDILTLQWPFTLLPGYSWLLFAMLGGFYLFMRALRMERLPSVLGAIMWTFSSYFIILITAGHIWKLMTLCFIPPTIAGIIHTYRGRYLLGGAMTALFAALQILSNHVQMSYYFAFLIVFLLIGYFVEALRGKALRSFIIATCVTLFAGAIAIGINGSNLYHTYEYGQETIRGGSELTPEATEGNQQQVQATAKGLDKEYITAWSYGKGETFTLLIPNLYGGASGALSEGSANMEDVPAEFQQIIGGMNHYWGDQPFTAGPVYVGAFVFFLFLLGIFIVRGPLKWALLAGTALSIALAWGHNMMWLTDLFIDYMPLYNKFRTVSSILVVAEFTIPALAVLALVEFARHPKEVLQDKVAVYASLALTLLPCLVLWLVPQTFLGLMSDAEHEMFRQAMGNSQLPVSSIMSSLKEVRAGIVSADALRSAIVIILSLVPCVLYAQGKIKKSLLFASIGVITLCDLWLVDKRYLNDDLFIPRHPNGYEIDTFMDGSILTIADAPWPGLTPDLLSVFLVTATQAKGSVLIHQKMFESRLFFVDKLIDMGAQIMLCDPHRAVVIGLGQSHQLRATKMTSPDIRAGIALLIAAMSAEGTSTINNIEQIDRGYQDIAARLNALGARISRL